MVQFDTRLPLAVQTPNVLGAVQQGTEMAGQVNALRRLAEEQNLYRQHGQGIASGDPTAMNALAQFNPGMAFDMGRQRAEDRRADRRLAISEEELGMAREAAARAAESHVLQMDAEEAAREAALIEQGLMKVAPLIAQARDTGDVTALNQGLRTLGMPPVESADEAMLLAAQHAGVYETLKRAGELSGGQGFRNATPEEAAQYGAQAGQFGPDGRFYPINPPSGTTLRQTADGFEFLQGPGVSGGAPSGVQLGGLSRGSGEARVPDGRSPTGTRIIPEPGSEAARAAEGEANKDREQRLKLGTTLTSLALNIMEIEDGGLPVAGPWGEARRTWVGRALTGNDAADFGNRTSQITDAAAFDEIQRMRDNSPTGGAVGQLTEQERIAIGNAVTAINDATSQSEYLRAAKAYRELALNLAYGEGRWELDRNGQAVAKEIAPMQAPDYLNEQDARLWEFYTPDEREAILNTYRGRQ